MTAAKIEVGVEVRVSLAGGLFLRGSVELETENEVRVRGRWFCKKDVKSADEIENAIVINERAERTRQLREKERLAEKKDSLLPEHMAVKSEVVESERKFKFENGIVYKPTGGERYEELVSMLITSADYVLWAETQGEKDALRCFSDYSLWTGGDRLPEKTIHAYPNRTNPVEWRLSFPFTEKFKYPFPIVEAGAQGKRPCGQGSPVGILKGSRVVLNYIGEIEKLIRAGLRVQ